MHHWNFNSAAGWKIKLLIIPWAPSRPPPGVAWIPQKKVIQTAPGRPSRACVNSATGNVNGDVATVFVESSMPPTTSFCDSFVLSHRWNITSCINPAARCCWAVFSLWPSAADKKYHGSTFHGPRPSHLVVVARWQVDLLRKVWRAIWLCKANWLNSSLWELSGVLFSFCRHVRYRYASMVMRWVGFFLQDVLSA